MCVCNHLKMRLHVKEKKSSATSGRMEQRNNWMWVKELKENFLRMEDPGTPTACRKGGRRRG